MYTSKSESRYAYVWIRVQLFVYDLRKLLISCAGIWADRSIHRSIDTASWRPSRSTSLCLQNSFPVFLWRRSTSYMEVRMMSLLNLARRRLYLQIIAKKYVYAKLNHEWLNPFDINFCHKQCFSHRYSGAFRKIKNRCVSQPAGDGFVRAAVELTDNQNIFKHHFKVSLNIGKCFCCSSAD